MPAVGKSIPHEAAIGHVTGEAIFIDDMVPRADELVVGIVGSPTASGRLERIDVSQARDVPGVVGIYTRDDVSGCNHFGAILSDEPFLAGEEVLYRGQPLCVIAARSSDAVDQARQQVRVAVRETPPVLDIQQALDRGRFIGPPRRIGRGHVDAVLAGAPHVLHGRFTLGGQEHFYLESQAALAYPDEQGQIIVHASTQNPTEIQAVVAQMLGLGQHQVVCVCKRMGGAFGGKETQGAIPAAMAALVAHHTGRPARLVYNKDDDMRVTGKRHAYLVDWQVAFDGDGTIRALRLHFFSDGGAAADLSTSVLERTMLHAENAYYIPNIEIHGRVCFTNLPPNTAFRGFGGPQAVAAMENIIQRVATHLSRDAYDIRRQNVYGNNERNTTPYGQILVRNHLPVILANLADRSSYKQRLAEVERHNTGSNAELRGIALTPVKFGISFTTRFLNQANALINVYADGTVQVSTGGTEMGQGLNTKIQQLVADEFGIDACHVRVMATSTEKNNNTSPTAASASTDLNGAAAVKACRVITSRIRQFAADLLASADEGLAPSVDHVELADGVVFDRRRSQRRIKFGELTELARRARVDLGARGFYATPGIDFNRETGRGNPFFYFTQGAAVAEVAIDRFTGETRVTRVDILIDIGESMNPGVDMGQITGGFIQGMGWVTSEQLRYDESGNLLSYSPTTYKIPAVTDLPAVFNVELFDNDDNVENVGRSKAVGEPPLILAVAVWAAIFHALTANGRQVDLRLPATGEEILRCLTEGLGQNVLVK